MKKKTVLLVIVVCLLFLLVIVCVRGNTADVPRQQDATGEQKNPEVSESLDDNGERDSKEETKAGQEEIKKQDVANDNRGEGGKELTQVPEVTFIDYSQNIKDEETGVLLLSVTENCPVISIPENENTAKKMNMVFEQQHTANQTYIEQDVEIARDAYRNLSEEEKKSWGGYSYGFSYKAVYVSTKLLSIQAESFEWQGIPQINTWTSSYCFDVTNGKLLSLSDIFTDISAVRGIVEQYILDTITSENYKDYLLDDYESYVPDILTEDVFYLNENGLVVLCNPYLVTSYESGIIEIEVPYKELKELMNTAYVVEN